VTFTFASRGLPHGLVFPSIATIDPSIKQLIS
jgi:hypothetical protein